MKPLLVLLVALFAALSTGLKGAVAQELVGWVEKVRVSPGDIFVKAKVDTGAKTSSLHCTCVTPVKRNGEEWVSFVVENYEGKMIRLERKVHRTAIIKRHFGKIEERPVILFFGQVKPTVWMIAG